MTSKTSSCYKEIAIIQKMAEVPNFQQPDGFIPNQLPPDIAETPHVERLPLSSILNLSNGERYARLRELQDKDVILDIDLPTKVIIARSPRNNIRGEIYGWLISPKKSYASDPFRIVLTEKQMGVLPSMLPKTEEGDFFLPVEMQLKSRVTWEPGTEPPTSFKLIGVIPQEIVATA